MKALRALALSLLVCAAALAQNAALMPVPHLQFFDGNGYPLAGGLIYTCVAGSSCPGTPLATYTDSTGSTANANPVALDGSGSASIWLGSSVYKIVVETSAGVIVSTTDNVSNTGFTLASLKCAASGIACLDSNSFVLQSELNYNQGATGAVNRTIQNRLQDAVSVKDFGATGNGTSDDTSAINAAITALGTSGGTVFFPVGTYKTTSTITLPTGVNLVALDNGMRDAGGQTIISSSFAGYQFEINATQGNLFQGLTLKNTYWGGTQGAAGCVRIDGVVGMLTFRDVKMTFNDTGFYGATSAQLISSVFENVYFTGDGGSNGLSRCISTYGRSSRILGGRAYSCHIGYDIAGDDWKLDSVDGEFNDIEIRTQAVAGMLVMNSHFETSGMLWTNATTLPTTTTYPWTDNGGNGIGWAGTIRFLNNTVFFNANGSSNPQNAPLFVVKSQSSMAGRLVLDGNDFVISGTSISPNFYSLSSSFNYTVTPALVSGVQVISYDALNVPTIPSDSYTAWLDLSKYGLNILGGYGGNLALLNGSETLTNGNLTLTNGSISAPAITLNGAALKPIYYAQTAAIGGSALAAGACATGSVSITGANAASAIAVSPDYYDPGQNFIVRGSVSGNGPTVNVYVCAITAGTPGSIQYNVRVIP